MVRPLGGRVPVQAVERDGLQRGFGVIGGQHRVPLKPVRVGLPLLPVRRTQAELEHGLKSPAEILIKETVNDGVDAAVEEGQPVGKGVDVNVDDSVLLLGQPGIVAQHHQGPQRQPGKDEEQSHNEEHFNHPLLFLGHGVAAVVSRLPFHGDSRFEKGDTYPGVHDNDERKGSEVDVCKQDSGVNLPHLLVGPVLSAPVKWAGFVVVAQ